MRHLIPTLTILLCLATTRVAAADTPLPDLDSLDAVIKDSRVYTQRYEQQIETLKQKYRRAATDDEQLTYCRDLFGKYYTFNLDSAYTYAVQKLRLARRLHYEDDIVFSELDIAGIFTKSGNYVEAYKTLKSLEQRPMSTSVRQYYYSLYGSLYETLGQTTIDHTMRSEYEALRIMYRDSLKNMETRKAPWDEAEFLCTRHQYTDALHILFESFNSLAKDSREMGYVAYSISNVYQEINDTEKEKQYLIISAISDIKNSIKEYISLRRLATLLYEEGDVDRAYRYMRKSMEDATFCNARLRIIEVSDALPIIDKAYDSMQRAERTYLTVGLAVVAVLLIMVAGLLAYTRKQLKRIAQARRDVERSNESLHELNMRLNSLNAELSETNGKLNNANNTLQESNVLLMEANKIKDIYIVEFMNKCSAYIDKLDAYRRSLNKLAANGMMKELYKKLKSKTIIDDEVDEFFEDFDRIFLKIFPDFVTSFNGLLRPDCGILPKKSGRLNTELRIFALMRLGIMESERIAAFLRCSKQTVYSYRSRIRLNAVSPDNFEEKVVKID